MEMTTKDRKAIENLVARVLPRVTDIRHRIHRNPEMGLKEYETAALIRRVLKPTGIRLLPPFLGTDVVAMLHGNGAGKNVTLRADIDALPLAEKTGAPYASKHNGFMHACGHDGHTAMLIGAALVLSELRKTFSGSVRFVFQPAEEITAAGRDLVEKGALKNPEPDAVFALHAWQGIPVGTLASKPGTFMAAADFFTITVRGKGAHGSMPHLSVDPILTAARIVEALQSIASRKVAPLDPVVVSVCRIAGGTNGNIIPDAVELEGTVRHLTPSVGKHIRGWMEQIIKGVCDAAGATYEFDYTGNYIPTVNHAEAVEVGKRTALALFGRKGWIDLTQPAMGGEDFAYYITEYAGAMFRLGMGEKSQNLHSPRFDFNDKALKNGIMFLAACALDVLEP